MSRLREPVRRHLVAAVARARPQERVEALRARLAREKPASLELALVVGADGRLTGVVPIARIFSAAAGALVSDAMREFPRVSADTDQERAASLALHHGVDALLQVLRREHVEDLHRLAGIQREAPQARESEAIAVRRLSLTPPALCTCWRANCAPACCSAPYWAWRAWCRSGSCSRVFGV